MAQAANPLTTQGTANGDISHGFKPPTLLLAARTANGDISR
jgi:hypothetical protein